MRKRFREIRRAMWIVGMLAMVAGSPERAAWADARPASGTPDEATDAIYEPGNRRDPFTPLVRDGKLVSPSTTATTSGIVGPMVLDGILWDPRGQSIALVNGTEVKKGDRIGGYVVRDIRQDAVVLEQGSETLVLQINFEAAPAPEKGEGS